MVRAILSYILRGYSSPAVENEVIEGHSSPA